MHESSRSRAIHACSIAIGLHGLGRTEEAKKYLEIARTLDPKSRSLSRAREMLGG